MKVQKKKIDEFPSAFSLLMPSWKAIRLNIITFIELIIIPVMFNLLSNIFQHNHSMSILFRIIGELSSIVFAPALVVTQLRSAKEQAIDFLPAVREGLKFFWRYLGLTLLMAAIILIGLILLIVPGVFMLKRYFLAPYFLIDQNLSIFDALKASANASKPFGTAIWGLLGVLFLFALLCIVFVGIVLVIMYYCAPAIRYYEIKTKLKKSKNFIVEHPAN